MKSLCLHPSWRNNATQTDRQQNEEANMYDNQAANTNFFIAIRHRALNSPSAC
jgi:hypothetical protein